MYGDKEYGDSDFGSKVAPVNVGDELEVTIEAVGAKGDGIAKKDGFVLFVPNTNQGDNVRIRITKVLRKVGFAEVVGESTAPEQGKSEKAPAEEAATEESAAEKEEPKEETEASTEEPPKDTENFGEELEKKK